MSDVEDDEFQDAQDIVPQHASMDLDTAIMDAKKATYYFFNNDFEAARKIMEPWATSSMYHSLGMSVFASIEAFLTFQKKLIDKAAGLIKQSMSVCSKQRKHVTLTQNIGKMVKKTNYDDYTIEEVHAELCYAESLLLRALLSFVEYEGLVSFVKGGLKIRTCFQSYKECLTILNSRKWENEEHKIHFESGVRTGIGAFNLMISLLPPKIIKLLEFVGFSGDKECGLSELEAGYSERRGLRHVLCAIFLLSYNLLISFTVDHHDGDLDWCEKALEKELSHYPNGVLFLYFKGRYEFARGNFESAIEWCIKSWKSQNLWPEFYDICYWELMWSHCSLQQWDEAATFAHNLMKDSNWSRTIYVYHKAAILLMQNPPPQKEDVDALMMIVPCYKQRIAGKSLPMEKFVIKKATRYFNQKKELILPVFELMYFWNLFRAIGKRQDLIMSIFKVIEKTEKEFANRSKTEFHADNEALLLLLKGACFRQMKHLFLAESCFKRVLEMDKVIKEDTYLLPYATVELAVLAYDQGNIPHAIELLEDAKKNFSGYLLESRLQLRIHSDLMEWSGKRGEDILE